MAFTKQVMVSDKSKVVEVYLKGRELERVLHQQGIELRLKEPEQTYCLTFRHNEIEEYDL